MGIAANVSLGSVLYVGGRLMKEGSITAGGLSKFALQSVFVGAGFSGLSTFYSDYIKALDAAVRYVNMLCLFFCYSCCIKLILYLIFFMEFY